MANHPPRAPGAPPACPPDTVAHGPFLIEPGGQLRTLRPPALRFAWRGCPCEAVMQGAALQIAVIAGRVPFTAEGAARRLPVLGALNQLPGALARGWRLRLLPDHRVQLEAESMLEQPSTAGLVAALVRFALALDPYLDRLAEAGLGTAST